MKNFQNLKRKCKKKTRRFYINSVTTIFGVLSIVLLINLQKAQRLIEIKDNTEFAFLAKLTKLVR